MKGRTLVLSIALLAGTVFPAQAMAQSDSNQKVEELQKQLDELRKQMSKLEAQLGELRSKATEAAAPTAAPPAAQEGTIQATLPPAQVLLLRVLITFLLIPNTTVFFAYRVRRRS